VSLQVQAQRTPETHSDPAIHNELPVTAVRAIVCPAFAFAFWTLATHVSVIFHLSFRTLAIFGPFALGTGLLCGAYVVEKLRHVSIPQPEAPLLRSSPVRWNYVAVAAALVIAHALGMGYSAFWIFSVLLFSLALVTDAKADPSADEKPAPLLAQHKAILLSLIVIAPAITYVAHKPKIDDAVYIGTAADAVAHPEMPVLSHDVLYGDQRLPLMLPSYAVESYELLIAFFAQLFGGAPIWWSHAFVPTLLAALVPIAWAGLMRILAPRHWISATALSVIILCLPGEFRGLGNFALVGLFVGKAVLVSVAIPLLFTYAWKFQESGSLAEWLIVAATTVACVGLSASAIFIVPIALVIAICSGWRQGDAKTAALLLLPVLYPLACGLAVSRGFHQLENVFANFPARAPLAVRTVFGARTESIFLFALLAAPFLQRSGRLKRRLLLLVLAYFLACLNPFIFKLLSRLTTRDAVWRVLWCVPVAGVVASSVSGGFQDSAARWGKRGSMVAALIVVGALAYALPHSSFAKSRGISYSLSPLKVVQPDYDIARAAIAATPPDSAALAPENIAVWVPTFVHRVPLVSVRELYDEEMGAHLPAEEQQTRRDLRELVTGKRFPDEYQDSLLNRLPAYSVGLIITSESADERLNRQLAWHGYSRESETHGYAFWRRVTGQ
jgi:Family of unknown function (DUF6077)